VACWITISLEKMGEIICGNNLREDRRKKGRERERKKKIQVPEI